MRAKPPMTPTRVNPLTHRRVKTVTRRKASPRIGEIGGLSGRSPRSLTPCLLGVRVMDFVSTTHPPKAPAGIRLSPSPSFVGSPIGTGTFSRRTPSLGPKPFRRAASCEASHTHCGKRPTWSDLATRRNVRRQPYSSATRTLPASGVDSSRTARSDARAEIPLAQSRSMIYVWTRTSRSLPTLVERPGHGRG